MLGRKYFRIQQTVEKGPSTALRSTASLRRTPKYASARRFLARLASGTFLTGLRIGVFDTLFVPATKRHGFIP